MVSPLIVAIMVQTRSFKDLIIFSVGIGGKKVCAAKGWWCLLLEYGNYAELFRHFFQRKIVGGEMYIAFSCIFLLLSRLQILKRLIR